MAANIGFDESLDIQYEIDPNEGGTQYRLFLSGSTQPISRKEEDAFNVDDLVVSMSFSLPLDNVDIKRDSFCSSRGLCD